ncbi:hypothetical protein MXD63_09345 [Frankia sp. Cpl3]|nr:hypothetical protein [Frankia sp. Cpl3]
MSEMSRRRLLTSTGVVGLMAATGFVATQPATATRVDAAVTDQFGRFRAGQIKDLKVGGRLVRIGESSSDLVVTVDGRQLNHVQVHRESPRGRYLSHLFPHHEFTDAQSLVKMLIEGDKTLFLL